MRNSLRFRLTACVCAALVLVYAVLLLSETDLVSKQLSARAENNARTLSLAVEKSLRSAMMKRRRDEVAAIIASVAELPQIRRVAILDDSGKIVVGSRARVGEDDSRLVRGMVEAASRTGTWTARQAQGDVLRMVSPIRNEQRCWTCHGSGAPYRGHLLVDLSTRSDRQALAHNKRIMLAGGVAALAATITIILVLMSTMVYRPIGRLMETMRRIKAGEVAVRADISAGDELCRVSEALNAMIVSLEDRNAEIIRTSERLHEAKRLAAIGYLAAGIAHEINNPTAAISMAVEGLARRVPADWPEHRLIELVGASADRIASLVSELLRVDPNRQRELKLLDINETVSQAFDLAHKGFTGPDHVTDLELTAEAQDILGDAGRLRAALVNVFTNALEAMPEGGRLTIRTSGTDEEVTITTSDTGCGIAEEDLPLVTEPFFTRKETDRGRGLGLAVACEIVAQHGGELSISSRIGQGTSVRICIPRKK